MIESRTFVLPVDDIDTDQIYPARFLTTTSRRNLGQLCFRDWRDGQSADQQIADWFTALDMEHRRVLVAGRNFGCGSSREHAVWSLMDLGFRAVVSSSFGDIFANNAARNGLLLIRVEPALLEKLLKAPDCRVRIDIDGRIATFEGVGDAEFHLDPFSAYCLAEEIDSLDYLLRREESIARFEQGRARSGTGPEAA